jgi:DNA-binding transcriptional regulator YhcF (GntR family)
LEALALILDTLSKGDGNIMQMAKILKDIISAHAGFEQKVEMIQAVQEKDMAEVKSDLTGLIIDLAELKTQLNEVLKICQEIKKEN